MDQADTLRRLMQQRNRFHDARNGGISDELESGSAPVITIASGKGGVGKSLLAANIGSALARSGLRVMLVDGDFGLANLDILFGVRSEVSLEQVLRQEASIQDAIMGIEHNLWLLPSSSGFTQARKWDPAARGELASILSRCPWEMDAILVDAGAGIGESVISLHNPSYQSVVVMTPEPTSLADAYGLVKKLHQEALIPHVSVVVNQVTDAREAQAAFQRLKEVAAKFINVKIEYLGHCPRDEKMIHSVMKRKILLDLDSGAPSVPCIELLARKLGERIRETAQHRGPDAASGDATSPTVGWSRLESRLGARYIESRFKDEPAHAAPGNTARFWRTVLGEVKA